MSSRSKKWKLKAGAAELERWLDEKCKALNDGETDFVHWSKPHESTYILSADLVDGIIEFHIDSSGETRGVLDNCQVFRSAATTIKGLDALFANFLERVREGQ